MNLRSPSRGAAAAACCPSGRSGGCGSRTSLSSLGDWLSLVALTALASALAGPGAAAQSAASAASGSSSLLPALLLGPLAGAVADRMDRRLNMIMGDVLRGGAVPVDPAGPVLHFVNTDLDLHRAVRGVLRVAVLDAGQGRHDPEPGAAGQAGAGQPVSLFTTYGTAPIAGLIFGLLVLVSRALGNVSHYFTPTR